MSNILNTWKINVVADSSFLFYYRRLFGDFFFCVSAAHLCHISKRYLRRVNRHLLGCFFICVVHHHHIFALCFLYLCFDCRWWLTVEMVHMYIAVFAECERTLRLCFRHSYCVFAQHSYNMYIHHYLCACIFKALLWQKVFNFWHMASDIFTLNFAFMRVCVSDTFFPLCIISNIGQRTAIISVGINAGDFGIAFASQHCFGAARSYLFSIVIVFILNNTTSHLHQ